MSFEKVSTILKLADAQNTSAMAFNCTDYNMVYSVIQVAEELKKPAIIMLYPDHCRETNTTCPAEFAAMVRYLAAQVNVPIGLHLDHCSDYDYIVGAIRDGFTSVMIDGSMLSVDENITITKKVVETAKIFDVDVEAELGHVGFAENQKDQNNLDLYTKAETAKRFCEETDASSIAVAIGSAHGFYTKTPKLDLDRLEEINQATNTPLVLHGGSGIPDDQLEIAFKKGINKFNVGTEFLKLNYDSIREYCEVNKDKGSTFEASIYIQDLLMSYLRDKMTLSKMTI